MFRLQDILKHVCNSTEDVVKLTPTQLKQLQSHLLEMYKDLEAICLKHRLQISLAYGNVIGVVRHGGWIPWDDDLDVIMPRKDYQILMEKYIGELPSKYRIYALESAVGPITRFPKMIDTSTTFESILDLAPEHHKGVFLDIFVYDNAPTSELKHKIKKCLAFGLMFIANCVNQKKNLTQQYREIVCNSKEGKKAFRLRQIIGTIFGMVRLESLYGLLDRLIQNHSDSGLVYCGASSGPGWKPMPTSMIFPSRKVKLEDGTEVRIPNMAEKFLDLQYGDWRKIPDHNDKWQHYVKKFKL